MDKINLTLILSIIIGTLIGIIVSFFTLILLEFWKDKRITNRWLFNLFLEIDNNKFRKVQEIKEIYYEIENTGFFNDIDFIDEFKCNSNILNEIKKSGINFDKNILLDYQNFITLEEQYYKCKKQYFKYYVFLSNDFKNIHDQKILNKGKVLFRSYSLPKLIRIFELQVIKIHELHKLISNLLLKNKIINKNNISDTSIITMVQVIHKLGEHEDYII